jgi:hypothetical protein
MKTINNNSKISKMISFLMIMFLLSSNAFSQMSFNKNLLHELKESVYLNSKTEPNVVPMLTIVSELSEDVMIVDWMMNPSELSEKSAAPSLIVPENLINDHVQIENWMIEPDWSFIDKEVQMGNWMNTLETGKL